ncbi:MAG: hypothetical protein CMG45_00475 [Candidatus Marinimicrobia bacterium]|nr:hypothetical protein [Candidatus Neomarinimicrobiota bacterium]|tara:strand:+ start:2359 stop:2790 length:432 start_codon:yes stop_codon:yes gene_type:complete
MKIIIPILVFNLIYSQNKKIDFNPDLLIDPELNWPQIVNPLSSSFSSKVAISSNNDSIPADIEGFRVQVFATQDRRKAEDIKEELSFKIDEGIHIIFEAPNYKVRIGDFLDRDNAEKLRMTLVKEGLSSSWIVRTKIQPKLKE